MSKRTAFLDFIILTALTLSVFLFVGCSETQPVQSEFSETTLTLTPQAFPAAPAGLVYELWVANAIGPEFRSLGRFIWDQNLYVMRDEAGTPRGRQFELDFSVLEWDFLLVSIETEGSAPAAIPGPIFMIDFIQDPEIDKFINMKFPISYDATTIGFVSMETPSDGNFTSDFSGVWFSVYSTGIFRSQDTLDIQVDRSSALKPQQIPRDSALDDTSFTTLDTIGIDSVFPVTYQKFSNFNLDTATINTVRIFYHIVPINKNSDTLIDTTVSPPETLIGLPDTITFGDLAHGETVIYEANMDYVFRLDPSVGSFSQRSTHAFTNGFIDLHSLVGTGWHYKGWILGPHQGTDETNFIRMNFGENKKFNWEKNNRLLFSTGIFFDTTIDSVLDMILITDFGAGSTIVKPLYTYSNEVGYNFRGQENNPYSLKAQRPPFPGEDFLTNLPPTSITNGGPPFNFLGTAADTAIAFISIEPDIYLDSTRNFPLIVLAREVAPRAGAIGSPLDALYDNMPMVNQSGIAEPFPDSRQSWPHIIVEHVLR